MGNVRCLLDLLRLQRKEFSVVLRRVGLFLIAHLGAACTAVGFKEPTLRLHLQYEDVKNSSILSSSSKTVMSADEFVPAEELPKTITRDFDAAAYCFVINTNGPGVEALHRDRKPGCENAFPGFGLLSDPFEWKKQSPSTVPVLLGTVRLDVMGVKKSVFGGSCPSSLSFSENASGQLVMNAGGKSVVLNRGIESLNPIFLSKTQTSIQPGENTVDLTLLTTGANPVGKMYGCQEFSIFPTPNSDRVLRTGMKKMFLKVECPDEADSIQAETSYGELLGEPAECDARGQAFLKLVEPSDEDLMASEYNWYLPTLSVAAYQGDSKIASLSFRLKYSRSSRYPSLKTADGDEEALISLAPGDSEFQISSLSDELIKIKVRNSLSGLASEYEIPVTQSGMTALAWSGQNVPRDALGLVDLWGSLDVVKDGFRGSLSDSALKIFKCVSRLNCGPNDLGVEAAVTSGELSRFDISITDRSSKAIRVGAEAGVAGAEIFDFAEQPWGGNILGAAITKDVNPGFHPEWRSPEIAFVRALDVDEVKDGIRSNFRDNWIAGGAMQDSFTGLLRAVLYRSPNAGKNWYRVYVGPLGSSLVDAKAMRVSYQYAPNAALREQPSFVLLEHRVTLNGFFDTPGELRVLVQDQHGF